MSQLNFAQVEECYQNGTMIDWHDDYKREAWKDAIGPLTVIDTSQIDWMIDKTTERCGFIRYTCGNKDCRLCVDDTLPIKGHFKVIRLNGLDPFGRVEYKETKKRTLVNIVDQPVFKIAESGDG